MYDFNKKRILFIGTGFFDYENAIIQEIKSRGAEVFYCSSSITSILKRILIRIGKGKIGPAVVSSKLMNILKSQPSNVDCIFIIKADNFREEHIRLINKRWSDTPKVLYLWDSLEWLSNGESIIHWFDHILTFDKKDAEKYGLTFRPLFFRESYDNDYVEDVKYDISFVGSSHTIRYAFLRKIRSQLDKMGASYKFVLRTGAFSLFFDKYFLQRIPRKDYEWFVSTPISYNDYLNISKESNVILDIANPHQTGLTMRTIETIGLGKKLMTTNRNIMEYGFDMKNISIVDMNNPCLDFGFIRQKNETKFNKNQYTLNSFVDDIFGVI